MQLKILEVNKKSGYIEVGYEMILDVNAQKQNATSASTVTRSGIAAYTIGTSVNAIKQDLVNRLNQIQDIETNDTTYQYHGTTYDGQNWSI